MNYKNLGGLKCIFYLFGLLALNAQAASFDCAKAQTKVEKLICSNTEISKLDEDLNAAYKASLQDVKHADSIKHAQKQWMKERNACLDGPCLKANYVQRIKQLEVSNVANTLNTQSANATQKNNVESRLSAGWDFRQEGGGGGTEPYTIGSNDVMCLQVRDYMNHVAPNWTADRENYCTSTVRFFRGFTEPQWTELDPRQHEELIAKLLRYRTEGAREYFGFEKPSPNRKEDSFYREEAYRFVEAGGHLQYWKTRLVDFIPDPKDFIDKRLPPGDQHVIQLRFAVNYSIDARFRNLSCRLPNWKGSVFIVTEDLSGPDPRIFDGGATGPLSSSSLLIYEGKPILLNDGGFEINIQKNKDSTDFLPACTFIYPYYKFEQRK